MASSSAAPSPVSTRFVPTMPMYPACERCAQYYQGVADEVTDPCNVDQQLLSATKCWRCIKGGAPCRTFTRPDIVAKVDRMLILTEEYAAARENATDEEGRKYFRQAQEEFALLNEQWLQDLSKYQKNRGSIIGDTKVTRKGVASGSQRFSNSVEDQMLEETQRIRQSLDSLSDNIAVMSHNFARFTDAVLPALSIHTDSYGVPDDFAADRRPVRHMTPEGTLRTPSLRPEGESPGLPPTGDDHADEEEDPALAAEIERRAAALRAAKAGKRPANQATGTLVGGATGGEGEGLGGDEEGLDDVLFNSNLAIATAESLLNPAGAGSQSQASGPQVAGPSGSKPLKRKRKTPEERLLEENAARGFGATN